MSAKEAPQEVESSVNKNVFKTDIIIVENILQINIKNNSGYAKQV